MVSKKFKNGEFNVEDKERSGWLKVYEDAELEALLDEDSCQTQEALTLGVTQPAISHRLKSLGMIQKQGNWVPYELKPRNADFSHVKCCLPGINEVYSWLVTGYVSHW